MTVSQTTEADEAVMSPPANLSRHASRTSASRASTKEPWWKIHLFRGMINDLRQRLPYYTSDWVDAWDYRVVPATVYMYFAKSVNDTHTAKTSCS